MVAGFATLGGSQIFTGGQLTWQVWEAAAINAGIAALYAFSKQVGGTQLANADLKVGNTMGRHAVGTLAQESLAERKAA